MALTADPLRRWVVRLHTRGCGPWSFRLVQGLTWGGLLALWLARVFGP